MKQKELFDKLKMLQMQQEEKKDIGSPEEIPINKE